jgi:hypothetical protein
MMATAPALRAGGDQIGRDDRADAEEGTVAQGRDDPAGHHHRVGGGQRTDGVADDEQHEQSEQHPFARQPGGRGGQPERTDDHRQGVAGDEPARCRLADPEVGRDLGQQAHDGELGQADPEAAEREGDESRRHRAPLSCEWMERVRW